MEIYIKDMEVPISCQECAFRVDESETNVREWICLINQYPTFYCKKSQGHAKDEEYLQDCPLIPIPPHGRLIDADALLQRAIPHGWSTPKWVSDIMIDDAPTVIPAEEGE